MLDQMLKVDRDIYLANNNSPQSIKIWDWGGGRDGRGLDKDFFKRKITLKKMGVRFLCKSNIPLQLNVIFLVYCIVFTLQIRPTIPICFSCEGCAARV